MSPSIDAPDGLWAAFIAGVVVLLLLDLVVFNKKAHRVTLREALFASSFFVSCALGVGAFIWWQFGAEKGLEYYTGYLVEQSLSVDNLFVFALLFRYFRVPPEYQHRVLFWGIFGAIVMRAIMIFAGVALLNRFEWLIYVFGAFLLYSGVKMLRPGDEPEDIDDSRVLRFMRRIMPVAPGLHGQRLFVRMQGRLMATRLFLVLIMVELTDVVFAVDSIPAILGITRDTFLVFSSNIMAILGLRSLFFVLADFIERFKYLHYGLALVLVFIGAKMLVAYWYHMPTWLSLVIVIGTISTSVVVSLLATRREGPPPALDEPPAEHLEEKKLDELEVPPGSGVTS
jgi:tellurite resistance protein TerC